MEQVQHIYNNIRDNNEIAIVERYGNKAKCYTNFLTGKNIFRFFFLFFYFILNQLIIFLFKH